MSFAARLGAAGVGAITAAALAQAPDTGDFSRGLRVTTAPGAPVQEFTLPDDVYRGVARPDLGDLRVFNAAGVVVPHSLCPGAAEARWLEAQAVLPVFALQPGTTPPAGGDTRVNVQTPSGTSVQISEGTLGAAPEPALAESWVADASSLRHAIHALQFEWRTPDGASQARVQIEASTDLDRWHTVVAGTTLLRAAADGRALDRSRVELPPAEYRYLRVTRADGPPVRIDRVTAEFRQPQAPAEPFWFRADATAVPEAEGFAFDSGRLAPVQAAHVTLPVANMALQVALDSRGGPEAPWRLRWAGAVSSVRAAGAAGRATADFAPTTDRQWRVRILRGAETLGGASPGLELAYHPARLRFAAQGAEPFVVGYGSARVPPAEVRGCDELLAEFPAAQRAALLGTAQVAAAPSGTFGGSEMLTPLPPPTPVRQIVLWAVLLAAASAVVAMALALLKRVRDEPADPPA